MFATRDGHGSRAGGTGGSSCGLAAAAGVMTWLAERGLGAPTEAGPLPVVA